MLEVVGTKKIIMFKIGEKVFFLGEEYEVKGIFPKSILIKNDQGETFKIEGNLYEIGNEYFPNIKYLDEEYLTSVN